MTCSTLASVGHVLGSARFAELAGRDRIDAGDRERLLLDQRSLLSTADGRPRVASWPGRVVLDDLCAEDVREKVLVAHVHGLDNGVVGVDVGVLCRTCCTGLAARRGSALSP
ncbi:MAG: hypothetical protein WKF83_17870 [Nocardioidaceae bacterium]